MIKTFFAIVGVVIAVMCFTSCDGGPIKTKTSVGKIQSATVAPIRYDAKTWHSITTEKASVCVSVEEVILIGREAYIVETERGYQYFTWDSAKRMYPITNNHF